MLEIISKMDHTVWSNGGYLVTAFVAYVLFRVLHSVPDRMLRWVLQTVCMLTAILMVVIFCVSSFYHGVRNCLGPADVFTRQCNMYDHMVARPGFAYLVLCIAIAASLLRSWRLLAKYMALCLVSGVFLAIDWYELAGEDEQRIAHSCWHIVTALLPIETLYVLVYAVLRRYNVKLDLEPAKTPVHKFIRKYFINRILRI